MGFLWAWVPQRKERKELEGAIKPTNRQERKALRQFGKAASRLELHETSLMKTEHSLAQLKGRLLEFKPPVKPRMMMLSANLTPFVPPGLVIDNSLFPALATVLIVAGMKRHDRQHMHLQVDYNPNTRTLNVEIPSVVPQEVLEAKMVKTAIGALSINVEHIVHIGNTRISMHAEKA